MRCILDRQTVRSLILISLNCSCWFIRSQNWWMSSWIFENDPVPCNSADMYDFMSDVTWARNVRIEKFLYYKHTGHLDLLQMGFHFLIRLPLTVYICMYSNSAHLHAFLHSNFIRCSRRDIYSSLFRSLEYLFFIFSVVFLLLTACQLKIFWLQIFPFASRNYRVPELWAT